MNKMMYNGCVDRYSVNGSTFVDNYNCCVLVGFKGILDELNSLNGEVERLRSENARLLDSNNNLRLLVDQYIK